MEPRKSLLHFPVFIFNTICHFILDIVQVGTTKKNIIFFLQTAYKKASLVLGYKTVKPLNLHSPENYIRSYFD